MKYTIVVGLDRRHLRQFQQTQRAIAANKPSMRKMPMVAFYDRHELTERDVLLVVGHPDLKVVPWPPEGVEYPGIVGSKWTDPQREKMLSGFVHVPAAHVRTEYWLKLDTDVVAAGQDDWVDPGWFVDKPSIVAHRWSFTKPADQMVRLDKWAEYGREYLFYLNSFPPLGLEPRSPDASRLGHKRIISWCGFFRTTFTDICSRWAENTCGRGRIPVPSQDGFMWYVATRLGNKVNRIDMKSRGWEHWSTDGNVRKAVERVLHEQE